MTDENEGFICIFFCDVWLLAFMATIRKLRLMKSRSLIFSSFRLQFCHHNLVRFRFFFLFRSRFIRYLFLFRNIMQVNHALRKWDFHVIFFKVLFYGRAKRILIWYHSPIGTHILKTIFTEFSLKSFA